MYIWICLAILWTQRLNVSPCVMLPQQKSCAKENLNGCQFSISEILQFFDYILIIKRVCKVNRLLLWQLNFIATKQRNIMFYLPNTSSNNCLIFIRLKYNIIWTRLFCNMVMKKDKPLCGNAFIRYTIEYTET